MYYNSEPVWHNAKPFFTYQAPQNVKSWIVERGSLTQRLLKSCDDFRVEVFDEFWGKPDLSEQIQLQQSNNKLCFIREVHLFCGDEPAVFARTVIPQNTLKGELQKLTKLGTQSLGSVLFDNNHIQRGEIQSCRVNKSHHIYHQALCYSHFFDRQVWGRRSPFYLKNKPLLVSEYFLPVIEKYSL